MTSLNQLLEPYVVIDRATTYSRAFSELVDIARNGVYEALRRWKHAPTVLQQGTLVTRSDREEHKKQFLLLSAMYPLLWIVARLDALLPLQPGYKLILRTRRLEGSPAASR